jgi:hypothetical protein
MRAWIVWALMVALASLGLTGCEKQTEPAAPAEPPKAEQPAPEPPKTEHPTGEHPKAEQPAGEHPTGEHPK